MSVTSPIRSLQKEYNMKLSNSKKAILALIFANMLWGMGPPIFKWSFDNVDIGTLAFVRFAIPTILLGILYNKDLVLPKKHLGTLFLIGFFDITFNIGFYFIGIFYTASINASIILAASPVFLILGSMILLREIPGKKMLLGNLIGLSGVLLIIVQPLFQKAEHASVLGNILLLFSALSAVLGTILAKKIIREYTTIAITFWSFTIGTITFFPFFISDTASYGFLPHLSSQGVIGIVFGILGTSLAAYFFYYWALKYFLASQTGVFSYLDPIASIIIAIPLLAEYPTPFFIFGTFLIFAGIYVAEKRINYHPFAKLLQPD